MSTVGADHLVPAYMSALGFARPPRICDITVFARRTVPKLATAPSLTPRGQPGRLAAIVTAIAGDAFTGGSCAFSCSLSRRAGIVPTEATEPVDILRCSQVRIDSTTFLLPRSSVPRLTCAAAAWSRLGFGMNAGEPSPGSPVLTTSAKPPPLQEP